MLRVLLTIVLPLLLPTAIYMAWIAFASRSANGEKLRLGAHAAGLAGACRRAAVGGLCW